MKALGNRFIFYFYATGIEKESQQFVRYPMHPSIDSCTEVILFTEKRDKFIRGKLVMTKSRRCKIDEVTANTLESKLKKLQEAGLIVRHEADKNGWWEVIES